MKKILSIILTLITVTALFAGCGKDDTNATPDEATADTAIVETVAETTDTSEAFVEESTISSKDKTVKQLVTDEGLKVSSDGKTVTDADGNKYKVEDGKVTVQTEDGENVTVAVKEIKEATDSSSKASSESKSGTSSKSTSNKSGNTTANTGTNTNTGGGSGNSTSKSGSNGSTSSKSTTSKSSSTSSKPSSSASSVPKPTQAPTQAPTKVSYTFDVDYFYEQTVAYAKSKGFRIDTSLTLDNAAWRNPDILFGKYLTEKSTDWWISNSGYGMIDGMVNYIGTLDDGTYVPSDCHINIIIHQLHEGVYYTELGRKATAQEDGGYTITIPYC